MQARTLLRVTVLVACVAVTALGYRNSNGDDTDAVAAATKAACGAEPCRASLEQTARGSFGHEYGFKTERAAAGKKQTAQVIVACERELVFVGDWKCKIK